MYTNEAETQSERLARLRDETAQRTQAASPQQLPVRPADVIHSLRTGTTISVGEGFMSSGHVTVAGENIVVTANMIAASYDNFGQSWLSIIHDDEAQIARWGEVRFRIGRAPEGVQTWNERGDSDWVQQREAARLAAWQQPAGQARNEAMAAVHARFGPAPTTSVTLNRNVDPSVAAAEEQQRELDEGGIRFSQHYVAQEPGQEGERR